MRPKVVLFIFFSCVVAVRFSFRPLFPAGKFSTYNQEQFARRLPAADSCSRRREWNEAYSVVRIFRTERASQVEIIAFFQQDYGYGPRQAHREVRRPHSFPGNTPAADFAGLNQVSAAYPYAPHVSRKSIFFIRSGRTLSCPTGKMKTIRLPPVMGMHSRNFAFHAPSPKTSPVQHGMLFVTCFGNCFLAVLMRPGVNPGEKEKQNPFFSRRTASH
jgi:hypothetical protein